MSAHVERTLRNEGDDEAVSSPRRTGLAGALARSVSGRPWPLRVLVGLGTAAVVLVIGCSWGAWSTATAASTRALSTTSAASGQTPVYEVGTGTVPGLGKVLVNGQGFTLYVFAPDKRSGSSKCYGQCAKAWPPLLLPTGVASPPAGSGVRSSLLSTTKRKDGTVQVTYNKWPLYTWVIDSSPGEATGQDLNNLGGKWYVITAGGKLITKHP